MQLIRWQVGDGSAPLIGMLDAGVVTSLRGVATMAGLLALPLSQIRQLCEDPGGDAVPYAKVSLLAPVAGTREVWAAGGKDVLLRVLTPQDVVPHFQDGGICGWGAPRVA